MPLGTRHPSAKRRRISRSHAKNGWVECVPYAPGHLSRAIANYRDCWTRNFERQAISSSSDWATAFLIAILLLENAALRAAIVVAVAFSAATIFIVPNSDAATSLPLSQEGFFSTVAGVPGESILSGLLHGSPIRGTEHSDYSVDGYRAPADRRNSSWTRDLRLEPVRCLLHPLQHDRPIARQGRAPSQAHKPALSGMREPLKDLR